MHAGHATVGIPFTTATVSGPHTDDKLDFFVIGDWGCGRFGCAKYGGPDGQFAVSDAMSLDAASDPVEFVINTGDAMYFYGVESLEDQKFNSTFTYVYYQDSLQVPWYGVLGNHDWKQNATVLVQDYLNWRIPALCYTVNGVVGDKTYSFFFIDTNSVEQVEICYARNQSNWGPLDASEIVACQNELSDIYNQVILWLSSALSASTADIKIVVGHEPVYATGRWAFTTDTAVGQLQRFLDPLLQEHEVDAYLCGHDHVMQHLSYGVVQYYISGAGGIGGADWEDQPTYRTTQATSHNSLTFSFAYARASLTSTELCMSFKAVRPMKDTDTGYYKQVDYGGRTVATAPSGTTSYEVCNPLNSAKEGSARKN